MSCGLVLIAMSHIMLPYQSTIAPYRALEQDRRSFFLPRLLPPSLPPTSLHSGATRMNSCDQFCRNMRNSNEDPQGFRRPPAVGGVLHCPDLEKGSHQCTTHCAMCPMGATTFFGQFARAEKLETRVKIGSSQLSFSIHAWWSRLWAEDGGSHRCNAIGVRKES